MTVHSGGHLLSHQQGGDLLLRRHVLPGLGLLQRIPNELGILLNLRPRETLRDPDI